MLSAFAEDFRDAANDKTRLLSRMCKLTDNSLLGLQGMWNIVSGRGKKIIIGTISIMVVVYGGIVVMNSLSSPSTGVGTALAELAPCPDSPNCVSTDASDSAHGIEPLPLADSEQQTVAILASSVSELPGGQSVLTKDNYLHFEFRSPWLRFVDDVEFLVDTDENVVHMRSAARVGRSDLGVNRERLEEIRRRYESALRANVKPEIDEFATIEKSEAEWQRQLTPEQYYVARKHGTERAFTGPNWDNKASGTYLCVCCELPLFSSETKYESGTGWPSFWNPLKKTSVEMQSDDSFFSRRTEVHCRRCKAHLGHVFEDGPDPTGLRYCMNGVAMQFEPTKKESEEAGGEE